MVLPGNHGNHVKLGIWSYMPSKWQNQNQANTLARFFPRRVRKTPSLPKIPNMLEARKLLYSMMLAAPVALMAGIGVHARSYEDPFQFPDSAADHRRINAYIPLVIESRQKFSEVGNGNETVLRDLARKWLAAQESGELQPLSPVGTDEFVPTGIKAKILESQLSVSKLLIQLAVQKSEHGQNSVALRDLLLASNVANIMKYSNFNTFFRCSLMQSHAISQLDKVFDELSTDEQNAALDTVRGIREHRGKLAIMANRARKIVIDAITVHEDIDVALASADRAVPSRSFFEQTASAKRIPTLGYDVVGAHYQIPSQFSTVQRALYADEQIRSMTKRIMDRRKSLRA